VTNRSAHVRRETKETRIDLRLVLDGGPVSVETDVDFFDHMLTALDDALVQCAVDLSGRPWLNYDVPFSVPALGALPTELVPHFFRSVVDHGKFNLHLLRWAGTNNHHLCEAAFKAFARALAQAKVVTANDAVPSTKGTLTG